MSQIVLADEINRATPRTQSALLEAMQERQVTLEGTTYRLQSPFMVMATQNPIELEGTFPLPEAQLDRFLIRLSVGYPTEEEEHMIVRRFQRDDPLQTLQPVASETEILEATRDSKEIHVSEAVREYVVNIIRTTRDHSELDLGASPRASMALFRLSQAWAAVDDRDFVLPDDVKFLAPYVLSHRIIVSPQTVLRGRSSDDIIMDIVDSVAVPVE
jgi:MoxR-like ATPase